MATTQLWLRLHGAEEVDGDQPRPWSSTGAGDPGDAVLRFSHKHASKNAQNDNERDRPCVWGRVLTALYGFADACRVRSVFLSFPFRAENNLLRDQVIRLIESFEMKAVTGESVGGATLQPTIFKLIENADALIAIMTKTRKYAKGGWGSSDWVRDEFGHAKSSGKPTLALLENGVQQTGAYSGDEHVTFKRTDPARYLLHLAATLGRWRSHAGRVLKVQILPEDFATELVADASCRYRLYAQNRGTWSVSTTTQLVREVGGTFAYVHGFTDEYLLEIEVEHKATRWRSPAISGWSQAKLFNGSAR